MPKVGKIAYKSVSKAKTAAAKSGKKIKYVPGKTYTK